MEIKTAYKQSEIGTFPNDWDVASLSTLCCSISDGTHFTPHYVTQGIPFFSVENVTANDFTNTKYISEADHAVLVKRCNPEKGDILMTRIGSLGDTKLLDWDVVASIYVSLALLKPNKVVSPEYLYRYTKSRTFILDVEKRSLLNAAPKKINMGSIGAIPIPFPKSITEQKEIAKALRDADDLINSIGQLIDKKRLVMQGAMQKLLTGKARLPGYSAKWKVKQLGEIAHIKTGKRNNQDKVEDGKYPFYVRSDTVEHINSYSYDCEAILVPGEGRIGSILHYIRGRFDVHQRVYTITQFSPEVSGKYVFFYMKVYFGAHAMQNSVKAAVDSLRLPTFQNFEISLPPTTDEQTAIATILSDMYSEIDILDNYRNKTIGIMQGMMQELLTGKTRFV
jgi:type I restriction enzyme S subunit